MNIDVNWTFLLMIFLVTFAIYSMDRNSETKLDKINHPERQNFISSRRKYFLYISIASYATAMIMASTTELRILLLLPLMFFTAYRYAGLKKIFLAKNITVAVAWATTITFLAASGAPLIPFAILGAFFSFFFLRTFAAAIAYDIKDIKGDSLFAITTLPVKIGVEKTKKVLYIMNVITSCLAVYYAFVFSSISILFIGMIAGYSILYVYRMGKTDIKFISDYLIHGEFILMGFLAYLGSMVGG